MGDGRGGDGKKTPQQPALHVHDDPGRDPNSPLPSHAPLGVPEAVPLRVPVPEALRLADAVSEGEAVSVGVGVRLDDGEGEGEEAGRVGVPAEGSDDGKEWSLWLYRRPSNGACGALNSSTYCKPHTYVKVATHSHPSPSCNAPEAEGGMAEALAESDTDAETLAEADGELAL